MPNFISVSSLVDKRDDYGEVLTLFMGKPLVVLNSSEAVYEASVKNADYFSNRPDLKDPVLVLTGGDNPNLNATQYAVHSLPPSLPSSLPPSHPLSLLSSLSFPLSFPLSFSLSFSLSTQLNRIKGTDYCNWWMLTRSWYSRFWSKAVSIWLSIYAHSYTSHTHSSMN